MATIDLLTLQEAKAALVGVTSSSSDGVIAGFVTALSKRLDDLCGPIVQRTVTELHDGACGAIYLRTTPLVSITSVTEFASTTGTVLSVETNASKPANGYLLVNDGHYVELRRRASGSDSSFSWGQSNVQVVFEAGRFAATASVGEDFKTAARLFLQHLFRPSMGGGSETYGPPIGVTTSGIPSFGLPRVVADLLTGERLPPGSY